MDSTTFLTVSAAFLWISMLGLPVLFGFMLRKGYRPDHAGVRTFTWGAARLHDHLRAGCRVAAREGVAVRRGVSPGVVRVHRLLLPARLGIGGRLRPARDRVRRDGERAAQGDPVGADLAHGCALDGPFTSPYESGPMRMLCGVNATRIASRSRAPNRWHLACGRRVCVRGRRCDRAHELQVDPIGGFRWQE